MDQKNKRNRESRIPSLDGIRGLGVVSVAYAHLCGTRGFVDSYPFDIGGIGLRFFFVLSGFIITLLLVGEYEKYGSISLSRFYFRRTMRIFPPYYLLILTVIVLRLLGLFDIPSSDIVKAASYTMNFFPDHSWLLGHTWSLAVEEQFYLLWPATIVVAGLSKSLRTAIIFFFLGSVFRLGTYWYFVSANLKIVGIGYTFPTIADSIAGGCVLALLRRKLETNVNYQRLLQSMIVPLAFVTIFVVHSQMNHSLVYWSIGMPIENLCITLCIHWAVLYHNGKVGKILNSRMLVFLGTISYSWYLWQQIFLNRHSTSVLCAFPQNLIASILIGSISFYLVEKPSLRLRQFLESRWSVGSRLVESTPQRNEGCAETLP